MNQEAKDMVDKIWSIQNGACGFLVAQSIAAIFFFSEFGPKIHQGSWWWALLLTILIASVSLLYRRIFNQLYQYETSLRKKSEYTQCVLDISEKVSVTRSRIVTAMTLITAIAAFLSMFECSYTSFCTLTSPSLAVKCH